MVSSFPYFRSLFLLNNSSRNSPFLAGQDIDTAIKEMKLMQTQLDEANAEIALLRSQGTTPMPVLASSL